MNFALDETQLARLKVWSAEQDRKWVEKQRAQKHASAFEGALAAEGIPYYGACGGELTYCFTPNSIGMVVRVKHVDGAEIDLTDYESW